MTLHNPCFECKNHYGREYSAACDKTCIFAKSVKELNALRRFKDYWDSLRGENLEIQNWHLNGNTEPFESFYESAMTEYNKEDGK